MVGRYAPPTAGFHRAFPVGSGLLLKTSLQNLIVKANNSCMEQV